MTREQMEAHLALHGWFPTLNQYVPEALYLAREDGCVAAVGKNGVWSSSSVSPQGVRYYRDRAQPWEAWSTEALHRVIIHIERERL